MSSIRKRVWTSRGIERSAWVVDYFDQAGKRHLKTFATKKAGRRLVSGGVARSEARHAHASQHELTVAEATERWIAHCEAEGLEFSTIKQRRSTSTSTSRPSSVARSCRRSPHRASISLTPI